MFDILNETTAGAIIIEFWRHPEIIPLACQNGGLSLFDEFPVAPRRLREASVKQS